MLLACPTDRILTLAVALAALAACSDDDAPLIDPLDPTIDTVSVDTIAVDTPEVAGSLSAEEVESDSGLVVVHPTYGQILRTAPARFAGLPDWPYAPRYVDVDPGDSIPLAMHYIDEGPREGEVVLLLHGNPAWGYLLRDMVGPITAAGYRVIVPDLIGFGRSDNPLSRETHTYDNHVAWMHAFADALDLREATMH